MDRRHAASPVTDHLGSGAACSSLSSQQCACVFKSRTLQDAKAWCDYTYYVAPRGTTKRIGGTHAVVVGLPPVDCGVHVRRRGGAYAGKLRPPALVRRPLNDEASEIRRAFLPGK